MFQTVEAIIQKDGKLCLVESISLPAARRALVPIPDDEPEPGAIELAMMSEPALSAEWDTPEEDLAWSHLAQLPSL
jgi:hypothetical protein